MMSRRQMLLMGGALTEYTVTGNPVAFNTNKAKPLTQCMAAFAPVQSGSGDPAPDNVRPISGWQGVKVTRTGKNLSEVATVTSQASSVLVDFGKDVTIPDGGLIVSMYVNGTVWSSTGGWLFDFEKANGDHGYKSVASCAVVAGVTITADTAFTGQFNYKLQGEITFRKLVLSTWNTISSSVNISNIQLELGAATAYSPYSGQTVSVEFPALGANLFDKSITFNGYINDGNGEFKPMSGDKCTDYIPVIGGESYRIITEQTQGAWGAWYDADKQFISGVTGYAVYSVQTAPENAAYVRLTVVRFGNGNIDTFALNYPSSVTAFEPYTTTAYGGTVDLATGTLRAEWASYTFDGTEEWTYDSSYSSFVVNGLITDARSMDSSVPNAICSAYVEIRRMQASSESGTFVLNSNAHTANRLYIKNTAYDDTTINDFKTSTIGLSICYELATPKTFADTQSVITTLIGDNTIWSDTNSDCTVTYLKKG